MSFQCLRVGTELYLANKLTGKKTMPERVQLEKYISAPITLRYGTSRPSNSSSFFYKDEMGHFSHQVIGQSLENLNDALYPYKKASKLS